MRLSIIFLCLTLVRSKKSYRETSSSSEESDEEPDYIPHVETTLDFRGNVRKLFALELALQAEGKNMICSPISAIIPLAKLLLGAKKDSESEQELMDAVGLKNKKELKPKFKQVIKELEYLEGVEINLASRLYISKNKKLSSKFKSRSERIFGSPAELIDFERPTEAATIINSWVFEHTKKKIKNVIEQKEITPHISLILVNAIYFRGDWKDPFGEMHIRKFHSPNGVIDAPMMSRSGHYSYIQCDELNAQILEIPYVGEESAMIIVLPYTKTGLPILLRTLKVSSELLNIALMKMKTAIVDVTIPKFTIETTLDLKHYYKKMGVKEVLSADRSHLNGIVKGENLHISSAIHKAMIDVNEMGTEAAAATGVQLKPLSYSPNKIIFVADRPFLFYVKAHHDQLFAGCVNKPGYP